MKNCNYGTEMLKTFHYHLEIKSWTEFTATPERPCVEFSEPVSLKGFMKNCNYSTEMLKRFQY